MFAKDCPSKILGMLLIEVKAGSKKGNILGRFKIDRKGEVGSNGLKLGGGSRLTEKEEVGINVGQFKGLQLGGGSN